MWFRVSLVLLVVFNLITLYLFLLLPSVEISSVQQVGKNVNRKEDDRVPEFDIGTVPSEMHNRRTTSPSFLLRRQQRTPDMQKFSTIPTALPTPAVSRPRNRDEQDSPLQDTGTSDNLVQDLTAFWGKDDSDGEDSIATGVEETVLSEDANPVDTLVMPKARYYPGHAVSEEQERACLENFMISRYNKSASQPETTVHDQLAFHIQILAEHASCRTSKKYVLLGTPHFQGGRILLNSYLVSKNWINLHIKVPLAPGNITVFDGLPKDTVMLLAACQRILPVTRIQKTVGLISMAPQERKHVLKVPFYQAIRDLFTSLDCDYRAFHPESFLVQNSNDCEQLTRILKSEKQTNQVWFLKSARESFGDGIAVRTAADALANEFSSCQGFAPKPNSRLLVQRGVQDIMQYDGRNSQGRAYFLISSYSPVASVWFFMGYFNIAGVSGAAMVEKAAHVTNLRSNQDSRRLLFHEFMQGRPQADVVVANRNIKRAALTAYLALKPKLGKNPGSFSLFGFDYLVQTDLKVKVLETNCNCELFSSEDKYGKERVMLSKALVSNMMDIVLASQLDSAAFGSLVSQFIAEGKLADNSYPVSPARRSWELIYSEVVDPPFMFGQNDTTQGPIVCP